MTPVRPAAPHRDGAASPGEPAGAVPPEEEIDFAGLRIRFDARVLRPRPWTAAQSLWGAELARGGPAGDVLELCAGAGQIGLLTVAREARRLVAVDIDPVACAFSRANAAAAGLGDLVEVREGAMDAVLGAGERFALVQADPPWVRRTDTGRFPEDPLRAIDGGDDGLDLARLCLRQGAAHLAGGGSLLLQLGSVAQADLLRAEPDVAPGLTWVEVREYDGGVVAHLRRD